ncbi:MAG: 30S ribosomal protein S20 [Acidobacteria bacterium]|nr:30S ribosomal protein S20 [Acidobacteriota bacterium]
MAKRTKSGLKAHRQNVKLREHNRELRTRMRSALKSIHALIDAKDVAGATAALGKTVSIVDKMATKGIIHTKTADRYKSRLGAGIARASA